MIRKLIPLMLLVTCLVTYAQIPTYYNDVNISLTGSALKTELATKVINTHTTTLSYTPGVWDALKQTDLDPNDSNKVLLLYGYNDSDGNYVTDRSRSKDLNGGTAGTQWNREHTFPKSLGDPNLATSGPGADVHHLRASDITMNGNRGSLQFIAGSGNAGVTGSGWYPGDEWKGDVARMMMYMYIRYDSRCYPNVVTIGTTNATDSNMIDLLLEWNAEDPVSSYELQRNSITESLQGNRNPFIDNPAFATTIWGGPQAENRFNSVSDCSELFISEYIEGSGDNKYLEIYNPTNSSVDLSTYDLVMYQNGSASVTSTLTLSGSLASGATFVIENSNENLGVTANLSDNTVMTFNGDDAIALRNSSTIIDVIGQIGTDPGSQWSGTTCNLGTGDAVLRRSFSVKVGDTDGSDTFNPDTEWTCSSVPDVSNLGSHNNVCLSKEIDIQGNNISIADGTTATSATNDTDFGSTTTSSGSIVKTFTILNSGGQTLTLSGNPVITGTNSGDFSVTVNPTLSIDGLSSTAFSITFTPSSDGSRTATVTVNSDDDDEGVYTFNIEGTGTSSSGGSGCDELFISEYHEGSSNNKYLEIYNPSSGSINLSDYDIVIYNNGSSTINSTLSLSGSINSLDTFVIENSNEALGVNADLSTSNSVMTFNGDDVIALRKNSVIIDVIGQIGTDPGSEWTGTTCTTGTANGVLRRNSNISSGDTDGSNTFNPDTEWTCASSDDVSNLGSYTNDCSNNNPEIDIQGNSISIPDGETATSTSNNTDFGTTNTASGSIAKTFTILNTGSQQLTISGDPLVTISGTNSSDFELTSIPSSTVANNSSTTFEITFNPSADGDRTATVTINSDDADEAEYTFNIKGNGTSGTQSCASTPGATIFQQDFEASPASPILTFSASGANTTTSTGNANTPNAPKYVSGSQGYQTNSGTGTIEFATIDASSYTNVGFSVRLASFSGTSGNGAEATDYVKVFVSTNSGTNYSEELTITGASANNARWSFTSGTGTATTPYDGNDSTTTFAPSGTGARTTDGYSTLTVTDLPSSSTLRVKIEMKNNSSNEFWVIDDAKFTADLESETTWNGSAWSNNAPNATTKAIIEGNYNMSTNPSFNSCECEIKSGSTLTISSGKFLTIEGNLINNGSIVLDNNASFVQVSSTATVSGSGLFSVNRTTASLPSKNVFTYWSSPLTSSTLGQVVSNARSYYSFLPGTQEWKAESNSTNMTPGVGYITQGDPGINYPSYYTAYFSGSAFNSGDINVSITYNDDADTDNDWNLLGNPYPSAIDADAFLSHNSSTIGGTLYFWTHNTDASLSKNFSQNDYVSWNGTGGIAGCDGCKAPTNSIASGQGFFAQGLSSQTATFTNAMRLSGENTNFYRQAASKKDKLWLNFSSKNSFSQILIGFMEDATDGVDQKYDGLRLDSGANASFYSIIDQKPYAIQGKSKLKGTEEIDLGATLNVTGEFTISIDHFEGNLENSEIILVDKLLEKEQNLKESGYTFSIDETGKHDNRFVLKTQTSDNFLEEQATQLIILNSQNQIEIKTSTNELIKDVVFYDLLGRKIMETKNKKANRIVVAPKLNAKSNLLIVKAVLDSGDVITKKIM